MTTSILNIVLKLLLKGLEYSIAGREGDGAQASLIEKGVLF